MEAQFIKMKFYLGYHTPLLLSPQMPHNGKQSCGKNSFWCLKALKLRLQKLIMRQIIPTYPSISILLVRYALALQVIPINGVDLGIEPSIVTFLPRDLVIALRHVEPSLGGKLLLHHGDEVFVVRDDHKLKVSLGSAGGNDLGEGNRQPTLILVVQVRGGLIQRHYSAVEAECLSQS